MNPYTVLLGNRPITTGDTYDEHIIAGRRSTTLKAITDEDCRLWGYETRKHLLLHLREQYPSIRLTDTVTILKMQVDRPIIEVNINLSFMIDQYTDVERLKERIGMTVHSDLHVFNVNQRRL